MAVWAGRPFHVGSETFHARKNAQDSGRSRNFQRTQGDTLMMLKPRLAISRFRTFMDL